MILRWRRPEGELPVRFAVHCPGRYHLHLDGAPLVRSQVRLDPGEHLLAVELFQLPPEGGAFLLGIGYGHGVAEDGPGLRLPPLLASSRADGTWRHSPEPPPGDWTAPDFDDAAWAPLPAREVPPPDDDLARWAYDGALGLGAQGLGLPPGATRVLVRTRFHLAGPSDEDADEG